MFSSFTIDIVPPGTTCVVTGDDAGATAYLVARVSGQDGQRVTIALVTDLPMFASWMDAYDAAVLLGAEPQEPERELIE